VAQAKAAFKAPTKPARASRSTPRPQPGDPRAPGEITRAWPYVREMLHRRGYEVDGAMEPAADAKVASATTPVYRLLRPMTQQDLDDALRKARDEGRRRARVDRPEGPILVVFTPVSKINVDTVRAVIERMKAASAGGGEAVRRALLLSVEGYTPKVPLEIAALAGRRVRIELALYGHHSFCPVDNRLVPEHDILSRDQKAALLSRLGLADDSLLPKQTRGDAVSRYYGLDVGDVVHYRRPMGTLELQHYYRVVIPD
jgi:DNA-directed RNA polymerase subunit H (RpoH/RPB5)